MCNLDKHSNTLTTPKKAIVIGASNGGLDLLSKLLPLINKKNKTPIFIVQHISPTSNSFFIEYLNEMSAVLIKEPILNEKIIPGTVYIAPPDYHMLIEDEITISLSKDEKVNFSRPSIDVLFETAAEVYGKNLIGIILTGANNDGSRGLKNIKEFGGYAIVQDPIDAETKDMPESAIKSTKVDEILNSDMLADYFKNIK